MIRRFVNNHGMTFFKFAMVGATGTLVDVGVFTLLLSLSALGDSLAGHTIAASISFALAMVNNYQWNRLWTFRHHHATHRQFVKFMIVSCGGWVLNALFFTLLSWVALQILGALPTSVSVLAKMFA